MAEYFKGDVAHHCGVPNRVDTFLFVEMAFLMLSIHLVCLLQHDASEASRGLNDGEEVRNPPQPTF